MCIELPMGMLCASHLSVCLQMEPSSSRVSKTQRNNKEANETMLKVGLVISVIRLLAGLDPGKTPKARAASAKDACHSIPS